mgnify:CR=1 FL=1
MAIRTLTVTIANTSTTAWTFPLRPTIAAGITGTGCALAASASPTFDGAVQLLTLAPGAQDNVSWQFDDAGLLAGTNFAFVKVFADTALTQCLAGASTSFTVVALAAQIVSITVT